MNKFLLGIMNLSLAVFAIFQLSQTDNANAEPMKVNSQKNTPIETTSHGCGCACGSCAKH